GRDVDAARAARRIAADARLLLLGVSRARVSAGRANGPVESCAAEAWRSVGAVRPRDRSARSAQRGGTEPGRAGEARRLRADRENRIGALAGKMMIGSHLTKRSVRMRSFLTAAVALSFVSLVSFVSFVS